MSERLEDDRRESLLNLPKVMVELIPPKMESKGTLQSKQFVIKDQEGKIIGDAILNVSVPKNGEASAYLNTINIPDPNVSGRGYGKSAYIEIIKYLGGTKLKSGFQLSRGTSKIWEFLVENGLARKLSEGKINEETENAGYSSAEYETI